jgi:transposase
MPTSPDTLLRIIRAMPLPELDTPKVLGVDDWSFRKGRKFGTILVDLERQRAVDLLPDRSAETLIAWLKEHPKIEVISRDRSTDYTRAGSKGAPQAVQVADRWHLLKNLGESLKHWLERHRVALNKAAKTLLPPPVKVARNERTEANQKLYEQIVALREQKFTFRRIAEKVGVSRARVGRWLKQGSHTICPKVQSKIAPYLRYAQKRYDEGITSVVQIYKEILEQGYVGTYAPLYSYFKALKSGWGESWPTQPEEIKQPEQPTVLAGDQPSVSTPTTSAPTPPARTLDLYGRIFALSTRPKEMNTDQAAWFKAVTEQLPEAKKLNHLAVKFQALVCQSPKQPVEQLKRWLVLCTDSGIKEMERLANGIQQDLRAVEAAITLPWSNGQVEGQVNKLKLIKRMMFGRANFDLLRKRVLLASLHGTCG